MTFEEKKIARRSILNNKFIEINLLICNLLMSIQFRSRNSWSLKTIQILKIIMIGITAVNYKTKFLSLYYYK